LEEFEEELKVIRSTLHSSFIKELDEMRSLSSFCNDFPELKKQYPELALDAFQNSNGLVQNSRSIEHYSHNEMSILGSQRKQTTYKTIFNDLPCIMKEITLDSKKLDYDMMLSRVVKHAQHCYTDELKIHCVFTDKSKRKFYIHEDMVDYNLKDFLEQEKPSKNVVENVLKDILNALKERSAPYSALKPQNVLVKKMKDNKFKALLAEPNFIETQEKQLNACLYMHKVIPGYPVLDMFQEEPSTQADIVCFGGLLLWALHQSGTFSNNVHSDVELVVEDCDLKDVLRNLLNPSPSERLSAEQALKHVYFEKISFVQEEEEEGEEKNEEEIVLQLSDKDETDSESAEESNIEQDGWEKALLEKKKKKKKKNAKKPLEENPENVSITDDDEF